MRSDLTDIVAFSNLQGTTFWNDGRGRHALIQFLDLNLAYDNLGVPVGGEANIVFDVTIGDVPDGLFLRTSGDELLIAGSVTEPGPFELSLSVRDAGGTMSDEIVVSLSASVEWTVEVVDLLRQFLGSDGEPLTPGELQYLDELGNRNGTYDVGDLRRWLGTPR